MAKKKSEEKVKTVKTSVVGLKSQTVEQSITDTLETNYMPYAMSVIVSRAIPEIDGFKPSHRKLLYTMYKMGLLSGAKTKSANIVGATMKLNPHGDATIYETMVRLSTGYEALLTPFVESKGNFGKVYSRDTSYAAPRYTEAKLAPICNEIFRDIEKDTVELTDNYDGTMKEPKLLPTSFPNILVSANSGIAVGMASMICGFNLNEVCQATIDYIKDPDTDIFSAMPAPDFPTGGEIIYNRAEMEKIYETGRGSFAVRARWRYVKESNIIEVYEIPYTSTTEEIIDKISVLIKSGKIREINDMRDETDLGGLKLAIDIKRGTDPEKLMNKLFSMTPLQDSFPCNFNILIGGNPVVMGVKGIIDEWSSWRIDCVRNKLYYELQKKKEKLHLLQGLDAILLDIDKAIAVIRGTEFEDEVVPNLMMEFGIDTVQAEYVAEIKLRNINREYILKRISEISELNRSIAELTDILADTRKVKKIIIEELRQINKKYPVPRRTGIVYEHEIETYSEQDAVPDYPVRFVLSSDGYLKKLSGQSLKAGAEYKFKDGDGLKISFDSTNRADLLVFTDRQQVYKVKASDIEDCKPAALGTYLPARLKMDAEELPLTIVDPGDYSKSAMFVYSNGKCARTQLDQYSTKTNRKKLTNAYSDRSVLKAVFVINADADYVLFSSDGRALIFNSAAIGVKSSKTNQGITVMNLKSKREITDCTLLSDSRIVNLTRYRAKNIPAAGAVLRNEDRGEEQLTISDELGM